MSKCWICGKEMTKTIGGCEHCKDCGTGYNDLVFRPQNETIIYHNKIGDNGTAIHLTCDSCGREVFSCNIVNGMKFCAKCYQETFGNQKKYVDMLNKESSELLINLLAEKDQQIAQLQKQLEEIKQTGSYQVMLMCQKENILLKQQLKSQPKEIVEKIRRWGQKHYNWVGDGTGYDGQNYNECIGFNMAVDQLNEILDAILNGVSYD